MYTEIAVVVVAEITEIALFNVSGVFEELKDTSVVSLAATTGLVILEDALALAGRTFSGDLLAFSFALVRHFPRECNETKANCMLRVREMERRRSVSVECV